MPSSPLDVDVIDTEEHKEDVEIEITEIKRIKNGVVFDTVPLNEKENSSGAVVPPSGKSGIASASFNFGTILI